jgi:predicted transcriptional regulator
MSRSMMVLRPEARLEDVAGMFRDSCHSRLAVVENGQLIGQVNRRDVLRTMLVLEEQQTTSESIRRIEIASSIMPNKPQFLDEMMGAKMPMTASDSIQPSL